MDILKNFAILPVVLLLNQLDMTNPNMIYLFMGIYCAVQLTQLLIMTYMYFKISRENSQVELIAEASLGKESQKMTQFEYDMSELRGLATKLVMPSAISFFMYYKFDIVRHFPIQSIMNAIAFVGEKLVKIHVFGQTGEELKRPFKVEQNFMQNWLQEKTQDGKEEKKSESKKEKAKESKKDK